jgi:hypothetical protein
MSFKLVNDLSIYSTRDKVEKFKISPKLASYLYSLPSPFIEKPEELPSGTVGYWDAIPIEVDNTIKGDYEIVWKENQNG